MKFKHLFLTIIFSGLQWVSYAQDETKIRISTEFGDMIIKLYNDTPIHGNNFIKNIKSGMYDGALFHRVIPYFMMQGGDPLSVNAEPDQHLGRDNCATIPSEILPHHFHKKGALAAARTPDNVNPTKASSGCQFYIVQGYKHTAAQLSSQEASSGKTIGPMQKAYYQARGGSPFLDGEYTVFGEVVEGLEVIDLIGAMETSKTITDRPIMDIKMKVEILKN